MEGLIATLGHRRAGRHAAGIVVTTELDRDLLEHVERGGRALLLARSRDAIAPGLELARPLAIHPRNLPHEDWADERNPWDGDWVTTWSWIRHDILPGLPERAPLDFAYQEVMPDHVIAGYDPERDGDEVAAGIFAGWVHAPAALAWTFPQGAGSLTVTTFRVAPEIGPGRLAPPRSSRASRCGSAADRARRAGQRAGAAGLMRVGMRTLAVLLMAAVAACAEPGATGLGSPSGSGSRAPGSGSTTPTSSAPSSPAVSPTVPEGQFINPVIDRNFADPFVLEVDGTYYAYATGNLTYNIQVTTSTDLVHWERAREALPRLPLWQPTSKGLTWAPEVTETDAGFVMHYTGRDVQAGMQCLGVATAVDPTGPFVDESNGPLLCQHDLGGSIEFESLPGRRRSRVTCCGRAMGTAAGSRSACSSRNWPLTPGRLVGEPTDLGLAVDAPWERNLIEAPTLLFHDGTYHLFFSANDYGSRNYAAGYATSAKVRGPYVDADENPILSTDIPVGTAGLPAGPGHQSIIADGAGDLWIVYHAWDSGLIGDSIGGRRSMWIDELVFEDGRPVVKGPDVGPQPVPAPP